MENMVSWIRGNLTFNNFPYLTMASNVFLGFGFGKIIATPAEDLTQSLLIKVLLIIGTCLFFHYLLCVRKVAKGISRNTQRKLRPFLKEVFLCGALNGLIFLLALSLFFYKSLYP